MVLYVMDNSRNGEDVFLAYFCCVPIPKGECYGRIGSVLLAELLFENEEQNLEIKIVKSLLPTDDEYKRAHVQ